MSEYQKLRNEFDQKIKELQDNCSHSELTDWQDEWLEPFSHPFLPGRGSPISVLSGRVVKYCKRCTKLIETKSLASHISETTRRGNNNEEGST